MKNILILTILFLSITSTFAQRGMRWKRTRYELMGGIGSSSFMGDLGGGKNPDSKIDDFVGDMDLLSTRMAIWAGMRYKLSPSFALRVSFIFGQVSGSDEWSGDVNRKARNLNFKSPIYEQSLQLEYSIIKETNSRKWNRRRKKKVRGASFNLYTFAGVGGFFFNPKGEDQYGNWVALQPLGTEGQTINGQDKRYSRYSLAIPFGLGAKIGINRKWDLGIEYGIRYTLTDYIDDVGTSYANNKAVIDANDGNESAGWLADKHLPDSDEGKFGSEVLQSEHEYYGIYQPGDRIPYNDTSSIRGGEAKDVYMFFLVSLSYKLRTKRNGLPRF